MEGKLIVSLQSVDSLMSALNLAEVKQKLLADIQAAPRDRNGYVAVEDLQGAEGDIRAQAMKELNKEGRFLDYHAYLNNGGWNVRPR